MYVIKRNGNREKVHFDKIEERIQALSYGLETVNVDLVSQRVIGDLYDGIKTSELDDITANVCSQLVNNSHEYSILAGRIVMSNLHKMTLDSFSENIQKMYAYVNPKTGKHSPMVSKKLLDIVNKNSQVLDSAIDYNMDLDYTHFGATTLKDSYLLKMDGNVVERPQQMLMRVALGIHGDDIDAAIETYMLMSKRVFTHATPTLFNSGTPNPTLSSCFLLTMNDDSISGIYKTLADCALISKSAGGIGLSVDEIRAKGSHISGTNGTSNGLVPMLRVFNNTALYVDQGGGKRKGSFAIYISPWHGDIYEVLDLRKNIGEEKYRARDLFYALWISDEFMKRVKDDLDWFLMCPKQSPGLSGVYGDEFSKLYNKYIDEGKYIKKVKARDLWDAIITAQVECGVPYILYKDAANQKSNQKNLGTIRCSNLCTEIIEYTSPEETACCNLASIALPKFTSGTRFDSDVVSIPTLKCDVSNRKGLVRTKDGIFDLNALCDVVRVCVRNLNKVIDINKYPTPESEKSNFRHRPIAIGVQGLADVFMKMNLPYDSDGAKQLNKDIFEAIYFAAVSESCEEAKKYGTYDSYQGSPASQGKLQFDLWGVEPSGRWNWSSLKKRIGIHGLRNSLLVAPMPTASTSQILGNTESFEPLSSNLYSRETKSGEFVIANPYLMRDLRDYGLWNDQLKNELIKNNGNITDIETIPKSIRDVYKTVWDISGKDIIEMSADRGAYICQSQSLNVHMSKPTTAKLTSYHFHAWKMGLKTGMYYLRTPETKSAQKPMIPVTVEETVNENVTLRCNVRKESDECMSCGS